jgi:hypothetical protein
MCDVPRLDVVRGLMERGLRVDRGGVDMEEGMWR